MLKTSSKVGKELLEKLTNLKLGESMALPSILPAVQDDCQAFLREKQENYWVLEAFWHGISMGELSAELNGDNTLTLEQL